MSAWKSETSPSMSPSAPSSAGSFDSTAQVLDLWECALTSGKTYAAVVSPTDGNCDVDLFMFQGSATPRPPLRQRRGRRVQQQHRHRRR